MSQLQALVFLSIGSLHCGVEPNSHLVAPLLPSFDDIANGDATLQHRGRIPTRVLGDITRQTSSAPTADHQVFLGLLRIFAGSLPDETLDGPPFVLSILDFNYQDLFVDDDGNVTSLIDWDDCRSQAKRICEVPSWTNGDWYLLMYGYPGFKNESTLWRQGSSVAQILSREQLLQED